MVIKIIECKGDSIKTYSITECDDFKIDGRHISIFKNNKQIYHLPARFFGIEVIED